MHTTCIKSKYQEQKAKIIYYFFKICTIFFRIQMNSGTKSKTNETNYKMLIMWKTRFVFFSSFFGSSLES